MFRNPATSMGAFIFANAILVYLLYQRIDSPLQFFLIAGGLVIFSFFLKRAIEQVIGV